MKTIFTTLALSLFSFAALFGQNEVAFNAGDNWIAFMNVFNLDGSYNFGSQWEVAQVKTTLNTNDNTITLQPNFNTYAQNVNDPFWVNQDNGEGNKTMEGLTFVEPGATFNGNSLTFSGEVESYTLSADYEAKFFIKALDPNNNFADVLNGSAVMDLPETGPFTVTVSGDQLPAGLLIQYGFSITGRNANPANEAELGSVIISGGPVSTNDLDALQIEVNVYPNPAAETLFIKSDTPVVDFEVATLLGQTLLQGNQVNNVDVSGLAAGTYLITVRLEEGSKTMKFYKN